MKKKILILLLSFITLISTALVPLADGVISISEYSGYLPTLRVDSIRYRYKSREEAYNSNVTYFMNDNRVLSTEDYTATNYFAPNLDLNNNSSVQDLRINTYMYDFETVGLQTAKQSFEWEFIPLNLQSKPGLTSAIHYMYFGDWLVSDGYNSGNLKLGLTSYYVDNMTVGVLHNWTPVTMPNTRASITAEYRVYTRNNVTGIVSGGSKITKTFNFNGDWLLITPYELIDGYTNLGSYVITDLRLAIQLRDDNPDVHHTLQLRSIMLEDCLFGSESYIREGEQSVRNVLYGKDIINTPTDWFGWVVNGVNGFMNLQLLPNVTLWTIFYGVFGLLLAILIMRKFSGG